MASSRDFQSEPQGKTSDDAASLQFQNTLPSNMASEVSAESGKDTPLEIRKFLKDKSILITGATGFLGKVLVEKILRAQPEIKQLYLTKGSFAAARTYLTEMAEGKYVIGSLPNDTISNTPPWVPLNLDSLDQL
ncbi:hypothetical protein R1sor_013370 [Riccia sorocarpa]|uniref:Fatty acyl-CoA reductase n=1 Tax=Riccia sorocarpa TaxID=122646 RepID=A0ABD3H8C4_9MARC